MPWVAAKWLSGHGVVCCEFIARWSCAEEENTNTSCLSELKPLTKTSTAQQNYSMDFMSDALVTGRKLRILKVIDDCTRHSFVVWCDLSFRAKRWLRFLIRSFVKEKNLARCGWIMWPEFTGRVLYNGVGIKRFPSNISSLVNPCRTHSLSIWTKPPEKMCWALICLRRLKNSVLTVTSSNISTTIQHHMNH